MSGGVILRVFIDQCVTDSAGQAFISAGHEAMFLREKIARNSPDELVAAVAESNEAILVSLDGDFKKIAKRRGVGRSKLRRLSLIKLSCRESKAAARIKFAMGLILYEWQLSSKLADRRLLMEIGDSFIRTNR